MKYSEVVEMAHKQSRTGFGKIDLVKCDIWEKGNQINLWTYWQGYQLDDIDEKGVDILLVGQDWGNPDKNEKVCDCIKDIQNGVEGAIYDATASPTDKRLINMFKAFGENTDITSKEPELRLFFTNYFLGYRGKSETGGMTKKIMRQDKDIFNELVEAINPKVIICLGKITYEMVIGHTVAGFTDKLKNGEPFKAFYPGTNDILVYGVAHPGSRGLYNIGGKEEKMKSAWEKIAQDYSMI
ncbi:MAG: uracil-DNA glycosylase family protein [Lachnospiraceae bacterium]|nr:uracil-DNA glycosylase family protein [Lachnospiraceae bacterium]